MCGEQAGTVETDRKQNLRQLLQQPLGSLDTDSLHTYIVCIYGQFKSKDLSTGDHCIVYLI